MRMTRAHNTPADRRGFTTVELMIVIVIIAIAVAIGAAAYSRMMFEAQKRTVGEHLRTVAGAIQLYYEEHRDYPAMRYNDLIAYGNTPNPNWPNHAGDALPNGVQSIEACLYALAYRSGAASVLQPLPTKVYRQQGNDTVTDGPANATQVRPLYVVVDPWGGPIQYVRPRVRLVNVGGVLTPDPNYPLSAERLSNRVLLVSMGPDGMPGAAGVNDATGSTVAPADVWQDNRGDGSVEWFPDPLQLGKGDDIVIEVGKTP